MAFTIAYMPESSCPCGRSDDRARRPLAFSACCGPYLASFDTQPAPDAETLMRSRYTAFVRGNAGYLLATWHASYRPASIEFEAGVKWLGLEVRDVQGRDNQAEIEFVARQKCPGRAATRLHERSRFVREEGRWFYLNGDVR